MQSHQTSSDLLVSGRTMNILLVDDRPENLLTLESILERDRRKIIKASGGNEALRIAIREQIGIILMDIQMPEIDGLEVARLLRSNNRTRHIPIIFVSAVSGTERQFLNEFDEGTVDCLSKPLNLEETKHKVAQAEIMYHLRMDQQDALRTVSFLAAEHDGFVSKIGHDLKSPMRAIHNLANWIHEDLGGIDHPNIQENLGLLKNRVLRLNAMLDAITEYEACGKLAEPDEDINLDQLAHVVFESMAPPAGFKLEVGTLPVIKGGVTRMYKIFHQLISNAVVHHPDPAKGRLKITSESRDGHHILSFSDNGAGIKLQYANRIFDMFVTVQQDDAAETTGSGLALVKRLVDGIGQQVWLDTDSGSGTVICMTLNRQQALKI